MLKEDLRSELLKIKDVVGAGIGEESGRPCVVVMLRKDNPEARNKIASLLKGTVYRVEITGEFRPLKMADS